MIRYAALIATSLSLTSCVTTTGWKQDGKAEQDQKHDNGECRAQANQTCNGNAFCANHAYGECMEGRGWHKD